ncbi:hypothetical protein LAZ67_2006368, partial [Cordylochernes scorpioides]
MRRNDSSNHHDRSSARSDKCNNGHIYRCPLKYTLPELECDFYNRFRSLDGSCNNLQHPTWGTAASCFNRILPAAYEDGWCGAGDSRVNHHLTLTTFHTVWMRYHNYVASSMAMVMPGWEDETLFQEASPNRVIMSEVSPLIGFTTDEPDRLKIHDAVEFSEVVTYCCCRRIVVGTIQMITYSEYLPWVVGKGRMDRHKLWVQEDDTRTQYDDNVDPTVSTDFSTAAFRFGHSTVQSMFSIWNRGVRFLRDTFFQPFELYKGDAVDDIILGMSYGHAERTDPFLVRDLTEFAFRRKSNISGFDLAAFNIYRGRDHGLRPYVDYLQLCSCKKVSSFDDLNDLMPEEYIENLEYVYNVGRHNECRRDVGDVDLFAGGLSETVVPGGSVGPTFSCIIAQQFARLKFGDRYYFEHEYEDGFFNNGRSWLCPYT